MTTITESQIQAAEQEWFENWAQGPTNLRWKNTPLQVGDPAPELKLLDSSGNDVNLADLWSTGPALLVFLRHFGCSCARDRIANLQNEYTDYVEAGVCQAPYLSSSETRPDYFGNPDY